MQHSENREMMKKERSTIDVLLYVLAGGVLATMSFSFLLWLRF